MNLNSENTSWVLWRRFNSLASQHLKKVFSEIKGGKIKKFKGTQDEGLNYHGNPIYKIILSQVAWAESQL